MNKNEINVALNFLKSEAERGNAIFQCSLGLFYLKGEVVRQDYNEAFRWFKAAAEQGLPEAQNFLGLCYSHGLGVIQNYNEAYYWYLISYRNGDKNAKHGVKRIKNILTDQQKQEVQDRVNEWFRTHAEE